MGDYKPFEILEHTADLRIKAKGRDVEELFTNMAKAMMYVLKNDIEKIPLRIERTIAVTSIDRETLLVDFLSELLSTADTYNEVYPSVTIVHLSEKEITAKIKGDTVDRFDEDIKAATYHGVAIQKEDGLFTVVVVFDI